VEASLCVQHREVDTRRSRSPDGYVYKDDNVGLPNESGPTQITFLGCKSDQQVIIRVLQHTAGSIFPATLSQHVELVKSTRPPSPFSLSNLNMS
jgi:hypothetical protein